MIAYIHGLDSKFNRSNPKVKALAELDEILPVTYDTHASYSSCMLKLHSIIAEHTYDLRLVGTSLGGFYAAHLASELDLPCVVINPSIDPYTSLGLESYRGKEIAKLKFKYRPLLLLDDGDELFDSDVTANKLKHFETIRYSGGNHRFAHIMQALPKIEKHFNIIETFFIDEESF